MTISWNQQKVRLGDLLPWKRNPRKISPKQAERLTESFNEFGQVETIALGPDYEVYNGHQRLKVLLDSNGPDYQIEARIASRALSEKEREKLTVYLHKGAAGEFDFGILKTEFDIDDLAEWGFDKDEIERLTREIKLPGEDPLDDPQNEINTILVEIQIEPTKAGDFLEQLKLLCSQYDGVTLNIS